jgi:two-component system sensor histidine kinase/response regulator
LALLMLTSDDLKLDLARVGQLGLDAYLVKPMRRRELFDAIAAAIARRNGDQRLAGAKPAASAEGALNAHRRALRVLLTDDSGDNRLLVRTFLKHSGVRIDEAENGLIAVEKAQAERYDIILMDIQMPIMDGLEAMRLIRRHERQEGLARVPIIALTASALESDVYHTIEAGADFHVSKPVKKATLIAVIESAVAATAQTSVSTPDHEARETEAAHRQPSGA